MKLQGEVETYGEDRFLVTRRVMTLTAVTATYQRPQAFKLCEKYMARQSRQPNQWLVLDGPEPMRDKVLAAINDGRIEGDYVAFVEDDDWYGAAWLSWCYAHLATYDIVGQGHAIYYNVARRWYSNCQNARHASLCNTAIRSELLPRLANVIEGFENNFFDTRLWRLDVRRMLQIPTEQFPRMVLGMKGLPGTTGYSAEHKATIPAGVTIDPAGRHLWRLIGEDAAPYIDFYQR